MNIANPDILLLAHAALGSLGCMAAVWVFVEALNARPETPTDKCGGFGGRDLHRGRIDIWRCYLIPPSPVRKDSYAPLKELMKSVAGHDWTTQGFIDLLLFLGLGLIFRNTRLAGKIHPDRLIGLLVGAVGIAGLGLALWFTFF